MDGYGWMVMSMDVNSRVFVGISHGFINFNGCQWMFHGGCADEC